MSDEIRRTGHWFELDVLEELVQRVTVAGVIVDAGAHIGNHSAFFAQRLPHLVIHAFEPWPANVALLRRNVARYPTVVVHPFALTDRTRLLPLVPDANLGHIRVSDEFGSYQADATALDLLGFRDVTLLKVDVEGHEPEVLAGAAVTIATSRPLILVEDWSPDGAYARLPELAHYRLLVAWADSHQTYLYGPR